MMIYALKIPDVRTAERADEASTTLLAISGVARVETDPSAELVRVDARPGMRREILDALRALGLQVREAANEQVSRFASIGDFTACSG